MARTAKASIRDLLVEVGMQFATDVARTLISQQFPALAPHLAKEKKPKRIRKLPKEVKVSDGLYYTPPPPGGKRGSQA